MNLRSVVVLISLFLAGSAGSEIHSAEIAFTGVNVVPLQGPELLSNYTVLVRDEKIVEMGPTDQIQVPITFTVIDGRNKYLVPGLTDMHVHVAVETSEEAGRQQLLLLLANGVTTILNAGDFGEAPLNEWAAKIKRGEMDGPNMYTAQYARGVKDGDPKWVQVTSPEQAREYVRQSKQKGYSFMKVYNYTEPPEFKAIIDEAKKQKMAVIGHIPQSVGLQEAVNGGMAMVAHVGAGGLFHSHYEAWVKPAAYPEMARLLRKAGVYVATTLVVEEVQAKVWGGSEKGWQEVLHQPGVQYADKSTIDRWVLKTKTQKLFSMGDRKPGGRDSAVEEMKKLTWVLHDNGVKLLLGSDAPPVLLMAGFSILRELEILKEIGFKPYDTLVIASRNAGEFIGQHVPGAEPFGTVEPGKRADLLLLEANPLEDIGNLRKRVGVMVRGRWFPETELQRRLQALQALVARERN